jgi:polar amino acid transport system substrate-binding protein
MKRGKAFLLAVCILAGFLCGCGYQGDGEAAGTEQMPVLRIGIDSSYEPYSYVDQNGNYAGLDIDLAREACRRMGREPVFTAIKWDNKNMYLEDGSIDCIWSCFSMNGREEDYDWVGPYMYSRQMVAVRSDSDVEVLSDLDGRRVAVMSSTKPESIFLEQADGDIPDVSDVYCMTDMDQVFAALQAGYVDAAAGHETVMRQYMATTSGNYRLLDEALQSVDVGIAFEKGKNAELAEELTQALDTMKADGTLQDLLEAYEIGADAVSSGGGQ